MLFVDHEVCIQHPVMVIDDGTVRGNKPVRPDTLTPVPPITLVNDRITKPSPCRGTRGRLVTTCRCRPLTNDAMDIVVTTK